MIIIQATTKLRKKARAENPDELANIVEEIMSNQEESAAGD